MPHQKSKQADIEINEQFARALEMLEHRGSHIFITGRAGTGKSTLLAYFRDHTKKKIVVLAPTGVAAVNVRGQTIHSFFGFKPDITLQKVHTLTKDSDAKRVRMYKKLDAVVIDEISMVRADMLDCIDKFLRLNGPKRDVPFGGVQMIFIGDLYQLPPVLTSADKAAYAREYDSPYFFAARVFSSPQKKLLNDENEFRMEFVELEKIYRQKDDAFIALLNAVRNNSATEQDIAAINARVDTAHEPAHGDFSVYLTPTNAYAAERNARELSRLSGKLWRLRGQMSGKFDPKHLPTDEVIDVKVGAQVMLLNNDRAGRWINGTIGKVKNITTQDGERTVWVELQNGDVEPVTPYTWDMYSYRYDAQKGYIESDTIGSFTQYPFKLAWAVTIHKAQGKTFDRVVFDIGRGTFAPGQLYVALSRCTSLEGLVLKKHISKRHIWMDWDVVRFVTGFQYGKSERAMPLSAKVALIQDAIKQKRVLSMTYLKGSDVKSRRRVQPRRVGEMEYMGKNYIGMEAYCLERGDDRVFRVDRILELEIAA